MAFNISAQIVLSGPKNLNTVANKIKKGLSGINIQIDPSAAKTLTTINTKVNTLALINVGSIIIALLINKFL